MGVRSALRRSFLIFGAFFMAVPVRLGATPVDLKALLEQARIYEKAGDYPGAERVYRQGLRIAPDNPEVLKRLGILEQTELKFNDSIRHFQQILSGSPQYPEINFYLGVSYLGLNQFQEAVESFQRELVTPHPHPRCHYYDAVALQSLGRIDDAAAQFHQSLAQNPNDLDALYQLARLYMNASIQTSQQLMNLDPDSFQIHALMGEIYANNGRYEESLKEYRAALAKRPDAPGIHYALGSALRNLKQIDAAEQEFLKARREDPNDPDVNLYLGEFAVGRQHYAEALDYLRIVSGARPGLARPHLLLGECYLALKDLTKAKTELLAAAAADSSDPQAHFLLAQVYREQGDRESSAREVKEFQELSLKEKARSYERAATTPQ